jgi:hypothetical protein
VSPNLIFPINGYSDIAYIVKSIVAKGCIISFTLSSLLESVIVTKVQPTEAYSSSDLAKARYSISILSKVKKESVTVRITHSLMELSLLEKLPIVQALKKFPAFYGTKRFITVFTRVIHWSLS